jgi:hypothetical protein
VVSHQDHFVLEQVVEELVGYLQAARMLAAAAAKAQPPTEELAALAPNGAAPQAPQEMDIDGTPRLPASGSPVPASCLYKQDGAHLSSQRSSALLLLSIASARHW